MIINWSTNDILTIVLVKEFFAWVNCGDYGRHYEFHEKMIWKYPSGKVLEEIWNVNIYPGLFVDNTENQELS